MSYFEPVLKPATHRFAEESAHPQEGATALKDRLGRARRERNRSPLNLTAEVSGQVNLVAGRLAEARAGLDAAGAGDEQGLAPVLRMVTMAGLAAHLGDNDLGRAAIAAAKRLRWADDSAGRRWADRVFALAAAQRGDIDYACRLLADDSLLPGSPPLPYDISFLVIAARIAVSAADQKMLERITVTAGVLAGAGPAFAAGTGHLRGLLDADAAGLLTAADQHAATGRPLLAAAAVEDAARVLVKGEGSSTAGLDQLNRALAIYTAVGAAGDAQRVEQLVRSRSMNRGGPARRPGMKRRPSSGWQSLTEAELNVVRIVAAGATNRDAAKRLFLSPHTVNAHIRSVFTKLGITSRVHLANMMRDNDG